MALFLLPKEAGHKYTHTHIHTVLYTASLLITAAFDIAELVCVSLTVKNDRIICFGKNLTLPFVCKWRTIGRVLILFLKTVAFFFIQFFNEWNPLWGAMTKFDTMLLAVCAFPEVNVSAAKFKRMKTCQKSVGPHFWLRVKSVALYYYSVHQAVCIVQTTMFQITIWNCACGRIQAKCNTAAWFNKISFNDPEKGKSLPWN